VQQEVNEQALVASQPERQTERVEINWGFTDELNS
jgi:hypothetical protein